MLLKLTWTESGGDALTSLVVVTDVALVACEELGVLDGSIKAELNTGELDVVVPVKPESLERVAVEDAELSKIEPMKLLEGDDLVVVSPSVVLDTTLPELDGTLDVSLSVSEDFIVF